MKSSTKQKPLNLDSNKRSLANKSKEKVLTDGETHLMATWQTEIEALMHRKFVDYEEALNAVIDGVIAKLDQSSLDYENAKEFLYEFLTGDPDLEKELKAIFNLS